jgi:hypothetical protein
MSEQESIEEIKEKIESFEDTGISSWWGKYLSIVTILIAVVTAMASLMSGSYADESLLEKNNAALFQNQASDQWSYYQAKGIKKSIADGFYQQTNIESYKNLSEKYTSEQNDIQKSAVELSKKVEYANIKSESLFQKHHKVAFAVTFMQIAVALIALASLMKKGLFFVVSLLFFVSGLILFLWGFLM